MPDEKTVVLSSSEWQQLVAIIANATGWMTFQKLLNQLQRPDGPEASMALSEDPDLPASLRRVPRA